MVTYRSVLLGLANAENIKLHAQEMGLSRNDLQRLKTWYADSSNMQLVMSSDQYYKRFRGCRKQPTIKNLKNLYLYINLT